MKGGIKNYFFAVFVSVCSFSAVAQHGVGIDNEPYLNGKEITLLDSILEVRKKEGYVKDTFDLEQKKVAFVTGPTGGRIIVKSNFYKNNIIPWLRKNKMPVVFPISLTPEEKLQSKGYDMILLVWVKEFTEIQKGRVLAQLANQNH